MSEHANSFIVETGRPMAVTRQPSLYVADGVCYQCGCRAWCLSLLMTGTATTPPAVALYCTICLPLIAGIVEAEGPSLEESGPAVQKTIDLATYERKG